PRRDDGAPRREWKPRGEGRDDRRGPRRDDRREFDDTPKNAAQQRRAEVFARKGPRKYGKDKPFADRQDRTEHVVDEGSVRGKRFDATQHKPAKRRPSRDRGGSPFPTPPALEEPLAREVRKAVGDRRFDYVSRQLSRALVAYDAERYREALAVLKPVLEDLWLINDVRVLAGRLEYRSQHWKAAAEHLEFARSSDRADMTNMPVLIDCYRALKRYEIVEQLWTEMKEHSPHPAVMAEGRVSAAMSHADRGDVQSAIRIMTHGGEPRQVQAHHLLEWYVLGDLYDRAGDAVTAKKYFAKVAQHDSKYFDVEVRLAGLGE
ncbi:MAG: hypothetical protein RL552_656, partial [Actinomycetota bacterium]